MLLKYAMGDQIAPKTYGICVHSVMRWFTFCEETALTQTIDLIRLEFGGNYMLTIPEIMQKAREIAGSQPITRDNYHAIAVQIHPEVKLPKGRILTEEENQILHDQYIESQAIRTEDWLELVVFTVVLWQRAKAILYRGNYATD